MANAILIECSEGHIIGFHKVVGSTLQIKGKCDVPMQDCLKCNLLHAKIIDGRGKDWLG